MAKKEEPKITAEQPQVDPKVMIDGLVQKAILQRLLLLQVFQHRWNLLRWLLKKQAEVFLKIR